MSPLATRDRSLRVAVLGVGAMGRLHARVFAEMRELFTLAGVYDPDAPSADEIGRTWSVPAFGSESQAIDSADLVVLASPIEAHAGTARRALARGRHVFVEKPVTATAAQALSLARLVGRSQRLFVGHSERYNPVIRALRERIPPDDVRTIRLRRTSPPAREARSGDDHGVLVTLGVHDLDLAAYLTASPVALRDVPHASDDRASLVLTATSGALAWVHVDRRTTERTRTIELVTRDAVYTGDLLEKTLTMQSLAGGLPTACALVSEEPLVAQASAIARAISGSVEQIASGMDGARALSLVEQAMARGATGPAESRAS